MATKASERAASTAMAFQRLLNEQWRRRKRIFGDRYTPTPTHIYLVYPNGKANNIAGIEFSSESLNNLEHGDVECHFFAGVGWKCWGGPGNPRYILLCNRTYYGERGKPFWGFDDNAVAWTMAVDWAKTVGCPYAATYSNANCPYQGTCTLSWGSPAWDGTRLYVRRGTPNTGIWSINPGRKKEWRLETSEIPDPHVLNYGYEWLYLEKPFWVGNNEFWWSIRAANEVKDFLAYNIVTKTWRKLSIPKYGDRLNAFEFPEIPSFWVPNSSGGTSEVHWNVMSRSMVGWGWNGSYMLTLWKQVWTAVWQVPPWPTPPYTTPVYLGRKNIYAYYFSSIQDGGVDTFGPLLPPPEPFEPIEQWYDWGAVPSPGWWFHWVPDLGKWFFYIYSEDTVNEVYHAPGIDSCSLIPVSGDKPQRWGYQSVATKNVMLAEDTATGDASLWSFNGTNWKRLHTGPGHAWGSAMYAGRYNPVGVPTTKLLRIGDEE